MKSLLILLVSVGLAMSASAQKVIRGGHYHRPGRVIVAPSFGFGYYSPFNRYYSPWYYPYGYDYSYRQKPSRLELELQDIRTDYADRIKSVRLNKEVPGKERRQTIRELKTERDKALIQAQKDYYYNRSGKSRPKSDS